MAVVFGVFIAHSGDQAVLDRIRKEISGAAYQFAVAFAVSECILSIRAGEKCEMVVPLVLSQEGNAGWNERKQNDFCFQSTRPAVVD
jgi:hypothetical protein